jgi:hypothetical protein
MSEFYTIRAYIHSGGWLSFPEWFPEDLPDYQDLSNTLEELEDLDNYKYWGVGYYDAKFKKVQDTCRSYPIFVIIELIRVGDCK